METETVDLVEVGDYILNLPAWFYVKTKDFGNPKRSAVWYKLVNPLSNARNLSTRKKEKSIELERSGIEKPELDIYTGADGSIPINRFSASDQKKLERYLRKDKTDKFAISPVIQRGRPEEMPKNILFNKTFKGYDQPYLDMIDNVKRGRIIPKLTTDLGGERRMPVDKSSDTSSKKTKSTESENEKIYDALMDLLGDEEEVKSAMSIADIPTPSTAYMISRLPENIKKAKSVKSDVSFPSSVSSKSSKKSSNSSKSSKSSKKEMDVEEAIRVINQKNPNQPFGELEGETFPMPKGTKGFERLYR